jgi:beta-glucanase (GH16 family)
VSLCRALALLLATALSAAILVACSPSNSLGGPPPTDDDYISPMTGASCPAGGTCWAVGRGTIVSHLLFDDEFSGTTLSSGWTAASTSNQANHEKECYSPRNVSVAGGFLQEVAEVGSVSGCDCPPSSTKACPYTSGAIQWRSLSFTYGTVQVRAKFAGGHGTWPTIWLLGTDCQTPIWDRNPCNWPAPGSNEIDMAEILFSHPTAINEQIHTESSAGTPVSPGCTAKVSDAAQNWHTYTMDWTPEAITWSIDRVQTCKVTSSVPTTPMFLIIDTAVGGCCSGPVHRATLPQSTEIDYVRVS